jgi:predicted dehydrogenase
MVGHVLRYFHEYVKAKEIIDSGSVGKVGMVRTTRGGRFPREGWYANHRMSGGVILDMIIHDFDFLRWCFGEVKRVYAKGTIYKGHKDTDYALVTLRFRNGVIAHVEGSWAHPSGFITRLEVVGDKGLLNLESEDSLPLRVEVKTRDSGQSVIVPESPVKESPYLLELRHFIDCVFNDKEPAITGQDALKAVGIAQAALESIKTGRVVEP